MKCVPSTTQRGASHTMDQGIISKIPSLIWVSRHACVSCEFPWARVPWQACRGPRTIDSGELALSFLHVGPGDWTPDHQPSIASAFTTEPSYQPNTMHLMIIKYHVLVSGCQSYIITQII